MGLSGGGGGGTTNNYNGLQDLLTGDDQSASASVGNWVASAGTLTRDTGAFLISPASFKHVTASTNQYIEVPVSGTFQSGKDYYALVWINSPFDAFAGVLSFGLIGTDAVVSGTLTIPAGDTTLVAIKWTPSADRTGVKVRVKTNATARETHVYWCRVFQSAELPIVSYNGTAWLGYIVDDLNTGGARRFGPTSGTRVYQDLAGISLFETRSYYQFTAGVDEVYLTLDEADASTVRLWDVDDIYTLRLEDQATSKWEHVDGSAVHRLLGKMESRAGFGTASIASGTTSITVTHGAGYTPDASDIVVTPTNNPTNDPGNFWISSIGATTFDINVRSNPGVSGADFAWRVDR